MPEIQPSVTPACAGASLSPRRRGQDILCAEVSAPPNAMVVFGASGNLAHRKLLPSIFELFARDLLDERFYLLGCGRTNLSDESFRELAKQAIRENIGQVSARDLNSFAEKLYYIDGEYGEPTFYERIKSRLAQLDKKHEVYDSLIYYLAVPPFLYTTIVEQLGLADLACPEKLSTKRQTRPEPS